MKYKRITRKVKYPDLSTFILDKKQLPWGYVLILERMIGSLSTHRGHGHAIAKGVELKLVLAELYGKATGCNGGRGGSMHIFSYADGLFGTNGFVGGGIPL
ncbi:MAG: thiamine pyrophosphate-dependent enzyme [Segetibacter sp.]